MLSVICDFLLADLKDTHTCINFQFELRITARQMPQTKHRKNICYDPQTKQQPSQWKMWSSVQKKEGKFSQTSRACW
jgi:hypothetical protein